MISSSRARVILAGLAFTAGVFAPLAPPSARAEGLQRFTGYTSPGTPDDKVLANGVIESAADEPKAFGGTIYFMVLDRGEGRGDDTWGSGVKDFDKRFQTGLNDALKPSPGLDKTARYLYLYQIVNDRGSKSPIHEATIRLIIDPAFITSWGFFAEAKKDKDKAPTGLGVGFAQEAGADAKIPVLPVGTEHPIGPVKRPFVQNAPRVSAPKPYAMSSIKVGNAPKAVADDPEAEDTGRNPVTVVLLKSADFQGAPEIHTQGRLATYDLNQARDLANGAAPVAPLAPLAAPAAPAAFENFVDNMGFAPFFPSAAPFSSVDAAGNPLAMANGMNPTIPGLRPVIFAAPGADGRPDSHRSPAIRAVFYDVEGDVPVRQNERSVLFGFTSNFPPMYEAVRLRGSVFAAAAAVDTAAAVGAAALDVDASEVPTPVAFEQAAPVTGLGAPAGTLGGGETVGAGGPVGGGAAPALGGLAGGVTGGGGGSPSGTSGNGQQAQQAQQAQQQQQQQPTPNNNGNTVTVTVSQNQQQEQQQQQKQKQEQEQEQEQEQNNNNHGNVVPEPASLASALLGVPCLFLFLRRKKPAVA